MAAGDSLGAHENSLPHHEALLPYHQGPQQPRVQIQDQRPEANKQLLALEALSCIVLPPASQRALSEQWALSEISSDTPVEKETVPARMKMLPLNMKHCYTTTKVCMVYRVGCRM